MKQSGVSAFARVARWFACAAVALLAQRGRARGAGDW